MQPRGRWIAVEGGDGTGKTTQCERLVAALDAVAASEPGGTRIGTKIREILLDRDLTEMDVRAEALLYAADRAQQYAQIIHPALCAGRHVVSSRTVWSSMAYQTARGADRDDIERINDYALDDHWPDLVIYLDLDPDDAGERVTARGTPDRLEAEGVTLQRAAREQFLRYAEADSEHWVVVDARGSIDDVAARIAAAVDAHLHTNASERQAA